jgi:hypothetical protein
LVQLEGAALAGMAKLQCLSLTSCLIMGACVSPGQDEGYGDEYILQYLPQLQQLQHLLLDTCLHGQSPYSKLSAAAYSALTSSSNLQSLNLTHCRVPPGIWQHWFSTGRQLVSLTSLDLVGVYHESFARPQPEGGNTYSYAAAPTGPCLASCCPSLRCVSLRFLEFTAEDLACLQGLSSLQQLVVHPATPADSETQLKVIRALCHVTQLQRLVLFGSVPEGLLPLQLTHLQGLTNLSILPRLDDQGQERQGLSLRQVRAIASPICPHRLTCISGLRSAAACSWATLVSGKYCRREAFQIHVCMRTVHMLDFPLSGHSIFFRVWFFLMFPGEKQPSMFACFCCAGPW